MPILEGFRKPPSWKGWVSSGSQCPCQPQTLACALGSDRPLPLKVLTCVCVPACTQAAALIEKHGLDDTTYLYDLGNTTRLFRAWRGALPRVTPFYAVKCNPEVRVVHDIFRVLLPNSMSCCCGCASMPLLSAATAQIMC